MALDTTIPIAATRTAMATRRHTNNNIASATNRPINRATTVAAPAIARATETTTMMGSMAGTQTTRARGTKPDTVMATPTARTTAAPVARSNMGLDITIPTVDTRAATGTRRRTNNSTVRRIRTAISG